MSRRKSCKGCYFYGECLGRKICEYFTPIGERGEKKEMKKNQKQAKEDFYREWDLYISYSDAHEDFSDYNDFDFSDDIDRGE